MTISEPCDPEIVALLTDLDDLGILLRCTMDEQAEARALAQVYYKALKRIASRGNHGPGQIASNALRDYKQPQWLR